MYFFVFSSCFLMRLNLTWARFSNQVGPEPGKGPVFKTVCLKVVESTFKHCPKKFLNQKSVGERYTNGLVVFKTQLQLPARLRTLLEVGHNKSTTEIRHLRIRKAPP